MMFVVETRARTVNQGGTDCSIRLDIRWDKKTKVSGKGVRALYRFIAEKVSDPFLDPFLWKRYPTPFWLPTR